MRLRPHLGRRGEAEDDAAFADFDQVIALAKFPDVATKCSALPCYASEPYPYPAPHKHVRRVYDAFRARRMLWGTDYSRRPVPYEDGLRLFTEGLDFLTLEDREWIVGRAAAHWVGGRSDRC